MVRRWVAELVGTFVLVFVGVGSAVVGVDRIGALGVALAFGLVLAALVAAIGPVSGCHVNPAVTLGVLLCRRIGAREAGLYVTAQVVGATAGAAVLALLVAVGGVADQTGGLGTNSWGQFVSGPGAFVLEVVLTALLVAVVLLVARPGAGGPDRAGAAGPAIGATLACCHLVGIGLDATSVNPARSLGPALLQGGSALTQVWLFVLAPLLGAALAAGVVGVLRPRPEGI